MAWLLWIEALAGVVIVAAVALEIFRFVVVPRPMGGPGIGKLVIRSLWRAWRAQGYRWRSDARRETWLGAFGPLGVLVLLVLWAIGLLLGSSVLLHALRDQIDPRPKHLGDAMYFAGSNLFTLGLGDFIPTAALTRVVTIGTAALGTGVVALVLAFLFLVIGSFQRREALVVTLEARAGSPPSGVTLLTTHAELGLGDKLGDTFAAWEHWAAEMLDAHLAYPILAYFRSSHDNDSWISALGAVLDAATLLLAAVEGGPQGQAQLLFTTGCHAVEDFAHYWDVPQIHDAGIEREEFEGALRTLAAAGYDLRPAQEAWPRFVDLRGQYAHPLNALARYWATPPARWIGDRSAIHEVHE